MSQAKPCIEYDPACVECRRDAGKDAAGTTWQCVGHVCLERDALRELMNVYNIGGWTDALVPVQRALKAEAERDAALAERDALSAQLEADLAAARAEVTRLYDELGRVSEELGLPRSIGPAPGWLKQQMADLNEARQLLATRVEADRLSEANDKIAALKSALESAAVGLGQSRVDRIAELENEVKTLRVFANAALEHQREAESALDTRLLDARLSGNALDDTIVERDEARAALTDARRVLREVLPVDCEHVYHPKRDQHPFDAACPVLRRAAAVLAQEEQS